MIQLYDKKTNVLLGRVSEKQLQVLIDQLEEESGDDQDYFLNRETLDMLGQTGADPQTLAILQGALNENGEGEIRWAYE